MSFFMFLAGCLSLPEMTRRYSMNVTMMSGISKGRRFYSPKRRKERGHRKKGMAAISAFPLNEDMWEKYGQKRLFLPVPP